MNEMKLRILELLLILVRDLLADRQPLPVMSDAACIPPAGYALTPIGGPGTLYFSDGFNLSAVTVPTPPWANDPSLKLSQDRVPYWAMP